MMKSSITKRQSRETLLKNAVVMLSALVVLAGGTLACQFGAVPTPTSEPIPTPTLEPTPTPLPLQAAGWEEVTVRTLCLEVEQSYPQMTGEFSLPVAQDVQSILTGLGLQVVTRGTLCDATLTFVLVGEALEARYLRWERCYSGADFRGQVILAMPRLDTLTLSVSGYVGTPYMISSCPYTPRDAPLEEAQWKAILDGLTHLWGPPVIIEAARLRRQDIHKLLAIDRAVFEALEEWGPEAIPILIQALGDRDEDVRWVAAQGLDDYGLEAMEATPALIEALRDESASVRLAALQALKAITGQDFGEDADVWKAWWEGQQ